MVAKVDVQLVEEAQKNFELTTVVVYNGKSKGKIVPNASNTIDTDKGIQVKAPTIPSDVQNIWKVIYNETNTKYDMVGVIYLFESSLPPAGNSFRNDVTGLVVGGYYENNKTDVTYYRVEFLDRLDYRPILRNHKYDVRVKQVQGRGYDSDDEAWNNKSVNLDVDVIEWADGGMVVVFDGPEVLYCSKDKFLFYYDEEKEPKLDNTFKISTSVKGGWKVDNMVDTATLNFPDWVTIKAINMPAPNENLDARGLGSLAESECVLLQNQHFR
jgi:hypothetical protein